MGRLPQNNLVDGMLSLQFLSEENVKRPKNEGIDSFDRFSNSFFVP